MNLNPGALRRGFFCREGFGLLVARCTGNAGGGIGHGVKSCLPNIIAADGALAVVTQLHALNGSVDLLYFLKCCVTEALKDFIAFVFDGAFLNIRVDRLAQRMVDIRYLAGQFIQTFFQSFSDLFEISHDDSSFKMKQMPDQRQQSHMSIFNGNLL